MPFKYQNTTIHRKYSLARSLISFLLEQNPEHEAIEELREICRNNDARGNLVPNTASQKHIDKFKAGIKRDFQEYRKIIYHFS